MAVDNPSYFSLQGGSSSNAATGSAASSAPQQRGGFGSFFRRSKSSVSSGNVSGLGTKNNSRAVVQQPTVHPVATIPRSLTAGTGVHQRRSLRNLFRSASVSADCEKTRQFLKGEPRPSDVAPPSPYLNSRSHVHSKFSGRRGPKPTNELLNMDMVFCGLPGDNGQVGHQRRSEDNDYYRFERDSECSEAATLPIDEMEEDTREYYNVTSTLPKLGNSMYSSMGRRKPNGQRRTRRHSIGTFLDRDPRCTLSTFGPRKPVAPRSTDLVIEPETSGDQVDCCSSEDDEDLGRGAVRSGRYGTRHAQASSFASRPLESSAPGSTGLHQQQQQQQTPRDDVVFVSSKDSETSALWVNYLTACFEQISRQQGRPPFRVTQVTFEEPQSPATDIKIRNSRLQIIVVCPVFLERVTERPDQATCMTRQLSGERVLAMMLGVQDAHLSVSQRASLVAYPTWKKFFVKDQDETFVGQFLGAAVAILGNSATGSLKIDKTAFSVHPKKVKMGQNRILALLNEPLHPDDSVTVTVDRCGEALEISHVKRRNPYTLQFAIPERCLDVSMLVGVRISRNGAPLGVRQVKCESRLRELDQILRAHDNPLEFMCQTFGFNPGDKDQLDNWMVHAFQKNIPPHFNLLSSPTGDLQLSKNHSSSEENPTLLHFAARFGLEKLAWQLLECPGADVACDMRNANDMTPADLAEQAGHVRLAHQLRGYMQMNEFSNMYSYLKVMSENTNGNANGYRAPSQATTLHPLSKLSDDDLTRQEDYCRPRPLSEAYSVPPIARPVLVNGANSPLARTFPDYSIPPPLPQPNPVVPQQQQQHHFQQQQQQQHHLQQQQQQQQMESSSTAVTTDDEPGDSNVSTPMMPIYASTSTLNASSLDLPLQGLRSPDSSGSTPTLTSSSSQLILPCPSQEAPGSTTTTTTEPRTEPCSDQLSSKSGHSRSSGSSAGKSRSEEPQDELLEIITDFKNNVFTISEVERLVENWRNRNDVQQSFKEKQRQLSAMRDEYERIQKRMKDEMKAPTPFDRIKKFFTKGKKDSKDSASTSEETTTSKQNGAAGNLADRRPVSSLSLHSVSSSSSSGRMSTVSGCSGTSLGDSGTHSDTDDRRLQHTNSEEKTTVSGMSSYEIPPAPKPYHGNGRLCNGVQQLHQHHHHHHHHHHQQTRYTPTLARVPCGSATNSELDLRVVKSSYPTADDKEYYIAFPPCGLPVHSFKADGTSREPTTPNTPVEDKAKPIDGEHFASGHANYANLGPILAPPPGMCIPFQYVNLGPANRDENVLTVQPDIHPEPSCHEPANPANENANNDNDEEEELPPPPESPKILNAEEQQLDQERGLPDYTNVQVAASEEIARNFGVTLKKLPGPPVPPRCEFSLPSNSDKPSKITE